VIDRPGGHRSGADERPDHERRNVAAAAGVVTPSAFVEQDEDDAVPELRALQERRELLPQPGVADPH